MTVELRALTAADVDAHNAGEDAETIRWLTGGRGTRETTRRHFDALAANAAAGTGQRGFGVWLDGRLAGYVDGNPDLEDGLEPGDVNLSYAVHPWARGRGVAVDAVELICSFIRDNELGIRAVIRVEPENDRSARVAERAGFICAGEVTSTTETRPDGTSTRFRRYLREL